MADHYQVSITAPSAAEASRLGTMAVQQRLAACAQVWGPITSTYWWEGKMTTEEEWVCALKTTAGLVGRLVDAVQRDHSYEVPEVIATPIDAGDPSYLRWVDDETADGVAGETSGS